MKGTDPKVCKRYARALFELSEFPKLDEIRAVLLAFAAAWEENPTLRTALLNPAIPLGERESVLQQISATLRNGDAQFANFLNLLLRNKRIHSVRQIATLFSNLIDELNKLLALEVTSARELSSEDRAAILAKVQKTCGSAATISWRIDKSILGGLTVKAGDKLLDGSVKGSLEKVRAQLFA